MDALSARLAKMLDNPLDPDLRGPGKLNDVRIVNVLVDRWAKLAAHDPRNLSLPELGNALGFDRRRMSLLRSAGIENLSGLAQLLKAVPAIERHNAAVARAPAIRKGQRAAAGPGRAPIASPIDRNQAAEIVKDIGDALFAALDDRQAS
ncbi:hypothetical protein QIH91_29150 [Bradyrhizobium japonicum USDA 135]|nr:hypothetical protein QIH91_29150 [Bradyrhizobium japonicum USDA 135]